MDKNSIVKAEVLSQALPYIQKYNSKIVVIKYGGNAMINEELKMNVIKDVVLLSEIGVKVILVHGGGPEINRTLDKMGKETQFINGLRYTDIHCCCLTFQAGIGCNDDFFNIGLKPLHQFLEFNIIWANSQHWGDGSVKYMVNTIILAGLLIGSQIPCILNHHDGLMVSPVTAADWTQFLIRKGKALLAVTHIIPGPGHGSRQFLHLLLGHVDDVKCQALGRFGPNSRKLGQLFY